MALPTDTKTSTPSKLSTYKLAYEPTKTWAEIKKTYKK